MSTVDERSINPIEEMTRLVQSFLDLAKWGFKESYQSVEPTKLIYDSEWCRVNLVWGGWDPIEGNSISVYYGRLHASNEKSTIIWNNEVFYCWHRFEYALHFLDGRASTEAASLNLSHPIKDQFYEPEFLRKFPRRQPEWLLRMHASIWQHYGKRLFELFDLRRPDLWEQYQEFLKQVYDIRGRSPNIKPSLDKVC